MHLAVLLGERPRCDGHRGGMQRCSCIYLHMGMGKIHWREEWDPIISRIKDRDIFSTKRYFFQYLFFWSVFLPSVGCRVG